MKDKIFFDTNIIAYSFDRSDSSKWKTCKGLVRRAFEGETEGYVSNQVLAELFVVLTRKVARPVSNDRAGTIVRSFVDSPSWKKLDYGAGTVWRAAADSATMTNPFWALLIAETMKEARVRRIYTENVRDFQGVTWVQAVNPFARD